MAIHYTLVFGMLVTEMVFFLLLTLPLPNHWRVKTLKFVSTSRLVAQLVHGIKIALIGVFILFVDAVNRMLSLTNDAQKPGLDMKTDAAAISSMHANKFYAQRNVYLTGFTLFMSFILTRTHVMILDLSTVAEQKVAEPAVVTSTDVKAKKVE
ncbi:B-cell receptor-associated protein 31-like-domain-containing protein [Syncephalis plumigaleata]|nr:B-cell receptor-associated protein 31-like-domain-containing protein [Syncephalis plumigaleata]